MRRAGFSLLEVLIAMLVLSLGAASLLSLFAAAAATHRRAVERTRAALAAERVEAELREVAIRGVTPAGMATEVKARLGEEVDGYRYDLLIAHPAGEAWAEGELFVRIAIRPGDGGGTREEAFHTVLLRRPEPSDR